MTHFGILCLPTSGHCNLITVLGRALQRRGHRVTAFNLLETELVLNGDRYRHAARKQQK